MFSNLFCLWFFLVQSGAPASQPVFEVRRDALVLKTQEQVFLLGSSQVSADFELSYQGALTDLDRLQGFLTGPGLSAAQLIDMPAKTLLMSVPGDLLTQEGDYQLSDICLVHDGQTVALAQPNQATLQVVSDILVSRVEVCQLDRDDLIRLGYVFNEEDYKSVEFTLGLVVGAQEIQVKVPVILPTKQTSSFAPIVLHDPFSPFVRAVVAPREPLGRIAGGRPDTDIETALESEDYMVHSLLLIPGNFHFLNTHFNVACVVLNDSPDGLDIQVSRLKARLKLPDPTAYGIPLTMTSDAEKDMLHGGPDGVIGTADDRSTVYPGEEASADYVLIGQVEGMYDVEIEVSGEVELPSGSQKVTSISTGKVYVRSPQFSTLFEHPEVVSTAEEYDLVMHFTNQGAVPLENLTVSMDPDLLVGTELYGSAAVQALPTVPPEGEASLTYHMRSLVTGRVVASYFKVNGGVQGDLRLSVGVGNMGEDLTPTVLSFPPVFEEVFSSNLTAPLKQYAKKLYDFSQMRAGDLPDGIQPITVGSVDALNESMARAAQANVFGLTHQEALVQLLSTTLRSVRDYAPMDQIRRKIIADQAIALEQAFGSVLNQAFLGASAEDIVTQVTYENETTPGGFFALVEGSGACDISVKDHSGRISAGTTQRDIPFSSLIPLDTQRTLVWLSSLEATPVLTVSPQGSGSVTVSVKAVMPENQSGFRYFVDVPETEIGTSLTLSFDADTGLTRMLQQDSMSERYGSVLEPKAFSLVDARHVDGAVCAEFDPFGRDLLFVFSKTLDLSSLDPIEEHVFINGEPAVDALVQQDGRFLFVSARMPLGPYRPIDTEIRGARSLDGLSLGTLSGSITGSNQFMGVTVTGRVVDRNGADLSQAQVFLWMEGAQGMAIFHRVYLDEDGEYDFDFVPFDFFSTEAKGFRVGVLLEDGRYESREFMPQGAGQEIRAEFAFMQLGRVWGQVFDGDLQPVAYAPVYVVNQLHPESAGVTQTDENGFYWVDGIEVGQILVKSSDQGIIGLASGYLTQFNSPLQIDLQISYDTGTVYGQVTHVVDGDSEPVANAYVGYAHIGSVVQTLEIAGGSLPYTALTRTDANGLYTLPEVPVGFGVAFVFDPTLGYLEQQIALIKDEVVQVDHVFTSSSSTETGVVSGSVVDITQVPVSGVLVQAGGHQTVTGVDGSFELTGIPLNFSVTVRASDVAGQRRGSVTVFLDDVQPVAENLEIVIRPEISVSGQLLDAEGAGIPFANIYISPEGYYGDGFLGTTDSQGLWEGVIEEAGTYAFSSLDPPRIASTETYVGPNGLADIIIQQQPTSSVIIKLVDAQGNPVVAHASMKCWQPSLHQSTYGVPVFSQAYDVITNDQGEYLFQTVSVGEVELWGHSQLLGGTEHFSFILEEQEEPQVITLAFGQDEMGNLFGVVTDVDGESPAPLGTIVQAEFGGVKAEMEVDENGWYCFTELTTTSQPVRVRVSAVDPSTGYYRVSYVELFQDLRFRHDMQLRQTGTVQVRVENADGSAADYAAIQFRHRGLAYTAPSIPEDPSTIVESVFLFETQITPSTPIAVFTDVPVGPFSVKAISGNGLTGFREYSVPIDGSLLDVCVRLEVPSSISGVFLDHSETPIGDAEIQLRKSDHLLMQVLSGTGGDEGLFSFTDLPMRTYELVGTDPATAFQGHLTVTPTPFDPDPVVELKLDPLAHLEGIVRQDGTPLPNAVVVLTQGNFEILTGTDAQGQYRFMNLPLGTYGLKASSTSTFAGARSSVVLDQDNVTVQHDLDFEPIFDVSLQVFLADETPASHVLVDVQKIDKRQMVGSMFTDADGCVVFRHLPAGRYAVTSQHPSLMCRMNDSFFLTGGEPSPVSRTAHFEGWGSVSGVVENSLGQPLEESVTVTFFHTLDNGLVETRTVSTDALGFYRIGRLPLNRRISFYAYHPVSREVANGTLTLQTHNEDYPLDLTFRATTFASGTVTFWNGSPVPSARVWLEYPVRRELRADAYGEFQIEPVLEGDNLLFAADPNSQRKTVATVAIDGEGGFLNPATNLELALSGVADVQGFVRLYDGTPVSKGSVSLTIDSLETELHTTILADGAYFFTQIPLGEYELTAYDANLAHTSPIHVTQADSDGQVVTQDLTFEESFLYGGTVYEPNGIDPSVNALVELWRPRPDRPSQRDLVYYTETDGDGIFYIEHVYPGDYTVHAEDATLSSVYSGTLVMQTQDLTGQIIVLEGLCQLSGTVADAGGRINPGRVELQSAFGTKVCGISPAGQYQFSDLPPGAYVLQAAVNSGWTAQSVSTTLVPGPNSVPIVTTQTVTLTGQVVLGGGVVATPRVYFRKSGINRYASVNSDGTFSIDGVPVGETLEWHAQYNRASRTTTVGPFTEDTDLGALVLDTSTPTVTFPAEGTPIENLPVTLEFLVDEPESQLNPSATRVWLADTEITQYFTTLSDRVTGTLPYFPVSVQMGINPLKISVANTEHGATVGNFDLNVALTDATLMVDLKNGYSPYVASARVDASDWADTDETGRVIWISVPRGEHTVYAKGAELGSRKRISIGANTVTHQVQLYVGPYGAYLGTVLDPQGEPVPNALVRIGSEVEIADRMGDYFFDFLPLSSYTVYAEADSRLGYTNGPVITIPDQAIPDVDIQLVGKGTVQGYVYDDDGITPMPNAAITLEYDTWPREMDQATTADGTGAYQFTDVVMDDFELEAFDAASGRAGRVTGLITTEGQTLDLDIVLSPSGSISGILLDPSDVPVAGITVEAKSTQTIYASAITDASGTFTLLKVPYGAVSLEANDQPALNYWEQDVTLNSASLDLGSINMVVDQPPQIGSLTLANPLDPVLNTTLTFSASDDRELESWSIVYSGVFEGGLDGSLSSASVSRSGGNGIPVGTPMGQLNYTLTVADIFGQTAELQGSVDVLYDLDGPSLTITNPVPYQAFTEGDVVSITATASDVSGVDRLEVHFDGDVLAVDTSSPYSMNIFAPGVDVAADVDLDVLAFDVRGNVTTATLPIHVLPKSGADGPSLTLLNPIDGVGLPIGLAQGLEIPIWAQVSDPDGLNSFVIALNGAIQAQGRIYGTETELNHVCVVPVDLRAEPALTLQVIVSDLAGNQTVQAATLNAVSGEVWTDLDPLNISKYDTTLDGLTHILAGGRHVIDGEHSFQNLVLVNGAILTQTGTDVNETHLAGSQLTVSESLVLDLGSQIDLDDCGYVIQPKHFDGVLSASHGGLGYDIDDSEESFGSIIQPKTCGPFRGGGAIKLEALHCFISGDIHASGFKDDGAGGSIWVVSDDFRGFGQLRANGFSIDFDATLNGAGGGRIAVHGDPGDLRMEAFGADAAGAGTVYVRKPDAGKPDGFDDRLWVANRPGSDHGNRTVLPYVTAVVGTDINVAYGVVVNGQTVDVVTWATPTAWMFDRYVGLRVFRPGEYATGGTIGGQTETQLYSAAGENFPAFVNGETLLIGVQFEQIDVLDGGRLELGGPDPGGFVSLDDGELVGGDQTIDLTVFGWQRGDTACLTGHYVSDALIVLPNDVLELNGSLQIPSLQVDAYGTLQTPDNVLGASLTVDATTMTIDGLVESGSTGQDYSADGITGFGHGGIGYLGTDTYGSLYRANTHAHNPNALWGGGHVHLVFDQLTVTAPGRIDASSQANGPGGSVLLEGTTLSGTGSIRADGNLPSYQHPTGGGRIAILVDDISAHTGPVTAFGADSANAGGAGTVFFRTLEWPNGKLLIDNNGYTSVPDSTPLPGLGSRVAASATGGASIVGDAFPPLDGLVGMYVQHGEDDPVRIASHTTDTLTPDGTFPAIASGETFSGLHILDVLHVVGGAHLFTIDPIDVLEEYVVDNATVNGVVDDLSQGETVVLEDGSLEMFTDNGTQNYELHNFQLTIHFPMNVVSIKLYGNSSLTHDEVLTAQTVELDGSQLISAVDTDDFAVIVGNMTLTNNATWIPADCVSGVRTFPLRAQIAGMLSVDATSTISSGGQNKVANAYLPWAGSTWNFKPHGGFGKLGGAVYEDKPVIGSFCRPVLDGNANGGGIIRIDAQTLVLDGEIRADGYSSGSGGSIWIDVDSISGSGLVSAKPATNLDCGGGRIAVYYGTDNSFLNTMTFDAKAPVTAIINSYGASGAGTLFFKSQSQTYGELVIEERDWGEQLYNRGIECRFRLTGVTGLEELETVLEDDDPDPAILTDRSWTHLPPGLGGLYARFDVAGTTYDIEIIDNTHNTLYFDPVQGAGLPAVIPAGTAFELVLKLDRLILKDGGQFHFAQTLKVGELVLQGGLQNSLWVGKIVGLPTDFTLTDQNFRLILEGGDLSTTDITLVNSTLLLDEPITLRDLTMTNSVISHSLVQNNMSFFPTPWVRLTAEDVSLDSTSQFDVSERVDYYLCPYGDIDGNHGGLSRATQPDVYGSPFQPQTLGNQGDAGGHLFLSCATLNGGYFAADGSTTSSPSSAGSILLNAGVMTGDIDLSAAGFTTYSAGGRIAFTYDDISSANVTFDANGYSGSAGPGTYFVKSNSATHGTLIIDNATETNLDFTPLPSFGPIAVPAGFSSTHDSQSGQTTLFIPGIEIFPFFADYYLVVNGNTTGALPIVGTQSDGTDTTFIVAGDLSTLVEGDVLEAAVWLDQLQLCPGCKTGPDELIILQDNPYDLTLPTIDMVDVAPLLVGDLESGQAFTVSFTASDNQGIDRATVSFDGTALVDTGIGPYGLGFTAPTVATATSYDIVIDVMDTYRNHAIQTIPITVMPPDTDPPAIVINQPSPDTVFDSNAVIDVIFTATDNRYIRRGEATFDGTTQFTNIDDPNLASSQEFSFSFTAPQLPGDQSLTIAMLATDTSNFSTNASVNVVIHDIVPPEDVTDLAYSATHDSLTFTWTASADTFGDLDAYEVTFDGGIPEILDPSTLTYGAANLSPETNYSFAIVAIDATGNRSTGANLIATTQPDLSQGQIPEPLAYWNFEDGGASDLLDFNGTNQIVTLPECPLISNVGAVTLAAWFYPEPGATGYHNVAFFSGTSTYPRLQIRYYIGATSAYMYLYARRVTGGSQATAYITSLPKLDDGAWHRVVGVVDFAGNALRLYLDGQLIAQQNNTPMGAGIAESDPSKYNFLGCQTSSLNKLTGRLTDVQLWHVAWDADNVTFDYTHPGGFITDDPLETQMTPFRHLAAHWQLNESSGTQILDNAGSGIHGTAATASWSAAANPVVSIVDLYGVIPGTLEAARIDMSGASGRALTNQSAAGGITFTSPPQLTSTGGFSCSTWLKLDQLPSAAGRDMTVAHFSSGDFDITVEQDDLLHVRSGTQDLQASVTAGTWNHVVVTVESSLSATLYVNGSSVQSATLDALPDLSGTFVLGNDNTGSAGLLGALDETALWVMPLTAQHVSDAHLAIDLRQILDDLWAPEDPTNLTWQASTTQLDFSWQPSLDSAGDLAAYHVYFDGATTPTVVTPPATTHCETGLGQDTAYSVRIAAVDAEGNESVGLQETAYTSPGTTSVSIPSPDAVWDFDMPSTSTGKYDFDGSGQYINLPASTLTSDAEAVTVAAWMRHNPGTTGYRTIFFASGTNSYPRINIRLYAAANYATLYLYTRRETSGSQASLTVSNINQLIDGEWHRIVAVVDYQNNQTRLFVDGEMAGELTSTPMGAGMSESAASQTMRIGREYSSNTMNGQIFDVQVWRTAWDADNASFDYTHPDGLITDDPNETLISPWFHLGARWLLDEGFGTAIADISGNGITGTATTDAWLNMTEPVVSLPEPIGQHVAVNHGAETAMDGIQAEALEFDGIDDFAVADTWPGFDPTLGATLSVWFRPDMLPSALVQDMILLGNDAMVLACRAADRLFWSVGEIELDGGIPVTTTTWHHACATFDPSQGLRVYLDGTQVGTATPPIATLNCGDAWFFGQKLPHFRNLDGSLDEIALWNQALDAQQVATLYQEGVVGTPALELAPDLTPPEDVPHIDWNATTDSITLNWTASADTDGDLAGYNVYFGANPVVSLGSGTLSHTEIGLNNGTTFQVRITAVDDSSNESAGKTVWPMTLFSDPSGALAAVPQAHWSYDTPGADAQKRFFPNQSGRALTSESAVNIARNVEALTMACWVKIPDTYATWSHYLMTVRDAGGNERAYLGLYGGKLQIKGRRLDAGTVSSFVATQTIEPDVWHRIVGVFDYMNDALSIYQDGAFVGQVTGLSSGPGLTADTAALNVYVGYGLSTSYYMRGYLWNAQIWRAAWTPDDIAYDALHPQALPSNHGTSNLNPTTQLAAWWMIDEGVDQITDHSGNGHDLTGNYGVWETMPDPYPIVDDLIADHDGANHAGIPSNDSRFGQALGLDGANAFVDVPHWQELSATTGFTFASWFKLDVLPSSSGSTMILADKCDGEHGLSLVIGPEDHLSVLTEQGPTLVSPWSCQVDTWHHAVIRMESNGTFSLFVDGNLADQQTFAGDFDSNAAAWLFGRRDSWNPGFLDGTLDEFTLWQGALSNAEIANLHLSGLSGSGIWDAVTDIWPPEDVTDLFWSADQTSLTFTWQPSADTAGDLAGYNVYFDGSATPTVLSSAATSHQETGLTPGQSYSFHITALDVDGNESPGVSVTAGTACDPGAGTTVPDPLAWWSLDHADTSNAKLDFNGTNSYVSMTATAEDMVRAAGAVTIAAWIKPFLAPGSYDRIMHISGASGGTPRAWFMFYNSYLRLETRREDSFGTFTVSGSDPIVQIDEWQRAVAVCDFTNDTFTLYLDGEQVAQGSGSASGPGITQDIASSLTVIGRSNDTLRFFDGTIWNVQVWRAAWDADNVAYDYLHPHSLVTDDPLETVLDPLVDLAGQWMIDAGSGTTIVDQTGHGYDGTANPSTPPWILGTDPFTLMVDSMGIMDGLAHFCDTTLDAHSGEALFLDGNGDFATVPHPTTPSLGSAGSISTWFKLQELPSTAGHDMILASKINSSAGFELAVRTDDRIELCTGTGLTLRAANPIAAATWHHATATWDSSSEMRIYLDGVLVASQAISASIGDTSDDMILGTGAMQSERYVHGIMDEVVLWSSALSQAQVGALYHHGPPVPTKRDAVAKLNAVKPETQGDALVADAAAAVDLDDHLELRNRTLHMDQWQTDKIVWLIGTHLELDTLLEAPGLILRDGSTITHTRRTPDQTQPLIIRLQGQLDIDQTSAIDLDGRGWHHDARTFNASHGGRASGADEPSVYDSIVFPNRPGGGQAGGGALIVEANAINLQGNITARGLGWSSGGSVSLFSRILFGNGAIDVSGGLLEDKVGGGGRIALHVEDLRWFNGTLSTGLLPEHFGSIAIEVPGQDALFLSGQFPILEDTPNPVSTLPHLTLVGQITQLKNQTGTVLDVITDQRLADYNGLWLTKGGDTVRIRDIIEVEANRYYIQIQGEAPKDWTNNLHFIIKTTQKPNPINKPGQLPLIQLQ